MNPDPNPNPKPNRNNPNSLLDTIILFDTTFGSACSMSKCVVTNMRGIINRFSR